MTMQSCDYVWYNGKKFTLIDCEENKDMIHSADFGLESSPNIDTSCRRGYTAEYFIEDNQLYGEKSIEVIDKTPEKSFATHLETSPSLKLNYTGSIIIAVNDDESWRLSDFLECYLNFNQAFELYFIDGELVEITSLLPAIEEWKNLKKVLDSKSAEWQEKSDLQEKTAKKYLKYKYGKGYKWPSWKD